LETGLSLTPALLEQIRGALRSVLSPRHLPDEITQVSAVPRTRTGKKLEVPIRKMLLGMPTDDVLQRDALANPDSLQFFVDRARARSMEVI
jgi:acetoacetyl-CoA synthetase